MKSFKDCSIKNCGVIFLVVVVCFSGSMAWGQPWSGSGTQEDPYRIYDANDMQAVGADPNFWDAHFELMADINLSGYDGENGNPSFNIIGNSSTPFRGVFDGNSHTISNFTYNCDKRSYVGVFGFVYSETAEIKDLGLLDPNITLGLPLNGYSVGSLVGIFWGKSITNCYSEGGSITGISNVGGLVGQSGSQGSYNIYISSCYSTSSVTATEQQVGGLVGYNDMRGTIQDCYATGEVRCIYTSSGNGVGGLVGTNHYGTISRSRAAGNVSGKILGVGGLAGISYGTISKCYSSGSVSGNKNYTGGFVGITSGTISNCYATGNVSGGSDNMGGLVGWNSGESSPGLIENCYSTGHVSGTGKSLGGLVGHNSQGDVNDCFWDTQTSGQATSDGGTPKTTAEMQDPNTFIDAGWDFFGESTNGIEEIWDMPPEGGYPILLWDMFYYVLTVQTEPSDVNTVTPAVGQHTLRGWVNISAGRFIDCPNVYSFDHWDGDVADGNAANTMVLMDSDKTITAVFADNRQCGDECHPYPAGDTSKDCEVNFFDMAILANSWLECTKPECD